MKNKGKIFTIFFIILLLIGSYFYDEDFSGLKPSNSVYESVADLNFENTEDRKTEDLTTSFVQMETPPSPGEITASETEKVSTEPTQESESLIQEDAENLTVQQGSPQTVEATSEKDTNSLSCTLSISCISVLKNLDKLKEEKREIIPQNGVILKETVVEFSSGDSVFDVLYRETKNNKIHLDFVSTPMYNSIYIKGIANLYEFDCGDLSGWFYKVNGENPNYGCSQYKLKANDKIEFYYTCNMFDGN